MTIDRLSGRDREAAAAASSEVLRLVIVSAFAVMLLIGGVYWLRQLPDKPGVPGSGSTVQVRLLQADDPTPIEASASERQAMVSRGNQDKSSEPEPLWSEDDEQAPPVPAQLDPLAPTNDALPPSVFRSSPTEATLKFRQALLQHIARFERYPTRARAKGVEGTVQVLFRLRRDGRILEARVTRSSGEPALDVEAIATLYRAEPLPAIPGEMPDELKILLPIDFSLQ